MVLLFTFEYTPQVTATEESKIMNQDNANLDHEDQKIYDELGLNQVYSKENPVSTEKQEVHCAIDKDTKQLNPYNQSIEAIEHEKNFASSPDQLILFEDSINLHILLSDIKNEVES